MRRGRVFFAETFAPFDVAPSDDAATAFAACSIAISDAPAISAFRSGCSVCLGALCALPPLVMAAQRGLVTAEVKTWKPILDDNNDDDDDDDDDDATAAAAAAAAADGNDEDDDEDESTPSPSSS